MRVTLIDHYDSFTHNLVDWLLRSKGICDVEIVEFDNTRKINQLFREFNDILVFSPGPNSPEDIPTSKSLLQKAYGKVPILGICLGFQLIAEHFGLRLTKVPKPFHGTAAELKIINQSGIFQGIQNNTEVAVYNSLGVAFSPDMDRRNLVSAVTGDGFIQAIEDYSYVHAPVIGVQFHPESFLTQESVKLICNLTKILERAKSARES